MGTVILLRHVLGDQLRRHRLAQDRTLREVSRAARVSLGYLSEVERGRKEASSELLGSICDALDVPLSTVLREVGDDLALHELLSGGMTTRGGTVPLVPLTAAPVPGGASDPAADECESAVVVDLAA
jgi:transcriptional regulator with XRE-family HTH domain